MNKNFNSQNVFLSLNNYLEKNNLNSNDYIFRVSMFSDYQKVVDFGSSRLNISKKIWYKNDLIKILNKDIILHEDVIIASYYDDLKNDSILKNGTLEHKLKIYNNPFFSLYFKNSLLYLDEEDGFGEQNKGCNFYFLKNPKQALFKNLFISNLFNDWIKCE